MDLGDDRPRANGDRDGHESEGYRRHRPRLRVSPINPMVIGYPIGTRGNGKRSSRGRVRTAGRPTLTH
jgi:hypothetical protein